MAERVLQQAEFNPAVIKYWLINLIIVSGFTLIGIPLMLLTIPVALLISGRILNAMSATLTERKLVVKRGIFFKVEKSIPLEKITDVGMEEGPIMRALGLQRLSFETAGQSGAGALVSMVGIVDAADFREAILKQKDVISEKGNRSSAETPDQSSDLAELTASVKRIEAMLEKLVNNHSGTA